MNQPEPTRIATFCGQCNCGCPELWYDPDAVDELRQVIITDDHGQRIEMSIAQLDDLSADLAGAIAKLKMQARADA
jgi:L-lactate utilization protein LutB